MMGDVEVDSLKAVMDVSHPYLIYCGSSHIKFFDTQLWLDNESGMDNLSSAISRITSAISGVSNAFLGQTRSKARLNAIASYDQSNELFKVMVYVVTVMTSSHRCFHY